MQQTERKKETNKPTTKKEQKQKLQKESKNTGTKK